MFLFESSKFLHDKVSSNEEILQIHKYWYRHDCVEKTAVDFDISYIFISSSRKRMVLHLGNFAHNMSQRIVLNHAVVYNEAVCGGIHIHSPYNRILYAHP